MSTTIEIKTREDFRVETQGLCDEIAGLILNVRETGRQTDERGRALARLEEALMWMEKDLVKVSTGF